MDLYDDRSAEADGYVSAAEALGDARVNGWQPAGDRFLVDRYDAYVQAADDQGCDPHTPEMWTVHGRPADAIGSRFSPDSDGYRWAVVRGSGVTLQRLNAYLPDQYEVFGWTYDGEGVVIRGRDNAGWTLDEYVLPRLASGMFFGKEVVIQSI
jgi:hypothetical protein